MSTLGLIEYNHASPEVRAVYDDIMATRKTDWINNFWKAIAHDAVRKGMTPEMFKELQAVIGMAAETNKLVTGYQVEVDPQFQLPFGARS